MWHWYKSVAARATKFLESHCVKSKYSVLQAFMCDAVLVGTHSWERDGVPVRKRRRSSLQMDNGKRRRAEPAAAAPQATLKAEQQAEMQVDSGSDRQCSGTAGSRAEPNARANVVLQQWELPAYSAEIEEYMWHGYECALPQRGGPAGAGPVALRSAQEPLLVRYNLKDERYQS